MIAHIIPIKRLPRHVGIFEYQVPKRLQTTIKLGQLVRIPFRQSIIYGLVFSVGQTVGKLSSQKLIKEIDSIVHTEPLIAPPYMHLWAKLARWYGVAIGTLAAMALPPLQKRKLEHMDLTTPTDIVLGTKFETGTYHLYHTAAEHATSVVGLTTGYTLILVPEVYLIDEVQKLLPPSRQDDVVLWHSQLTTKQQWDAWFHIRNQSRHIIIGTRGAVLLPIPHLDTLIVDYEHDANHKHWDQSPRFHVKDITPHLAQLHGAELHWMSYIPSHEAYYALHKKKMGGQMTLEIAASTKKITLIDMREERRARRFSFLSDMAVDALLEAHNDIFLLVHRRGFATSVGCQSCGHLEICPACQQPLIFHEATRTLQCHYCRQKLPMPLLCPRCQSPLTQLRGAGTEFVEKEVRRIMQKRNKCHILRRDSETEGDPLPEDTHPRIIIGTEMAFSAIRWDKTDLVIFADIDKKLAIPEYRTLEHVWQLVSEIQFRRSSTSTFLIQTFVPEHLLFRSLSEPDRLYRTDLHARRQLHYPPYGYVARFLYSHPDADTAYREAARLSYTLSQALTDTKKNIILTPPLQLIPGFYRNQFWYILIAKFDNETWTEDLVWLNQQIGGNWKIDPHPNTLLTP